MTQPAQQTYLCLDDDLDAVDELLDLLMVSLPQLVIQGKPPLPFDDQIKAISDAAKTSKLSGLILDLRLDQLKTDELPMARYSAPSLAQEIRTLMTQKRIPAFPIVLWSIDQKMAKSYDPDATSHDLFDWYFVAKRASFHELLRVPAQLRYWKPFADALAPR